MFGDVSYLLEDPALVADTWLNLASAIFFLVNPQPPKPSMLHVIDRTWVPNAADKAAGRVLGFGSTIMVINGGLECGQNAEVATAANRIKYFSSFVEHFKLQIPADEPTSCIGMK
ncbi:MAG: chitinase [Aeromonas sp.]